MTKEEFERLLERIQKEERRVRADGQAEYAHDPRNCFDNFDRIARELGMEPEAVLWVYFLKHVDGITAWINGHHSQREDIRGRLKDARMYLALLWGMVERVDDHGQSGGIPEEKDMDAAFPVAGVHKAQQMELISPTQDVQR